MKNELNQFLINFGQWTNSIESNTTTFFVLQIYV